MISLNPRIETASVKLPTPGLRNNSVGYAPLHRQHLDGASCFDSIKTKRNLSVFQTETSKQEDLMNSLDE